MATFKDLLAAAKAVITEIDTAGAAEKISGGDVVVLDVREPDEYAEGAVPGALHIPRGHLEAQVEGRITDKNTAIVVYCAGGVRSAFAARTLGELGYANVLSMAGGYGKWKDEGRPWTTPAALTPEQTNRYKRLRLAKLLLQVRYQTHFHIDVCLDGDGELRTLSLVDFLALEDDK